MTVDLAPHPARWSQTVLDAIAANGFELLPDHGRVLDPFAGVGLDRLAHCFGSGLEVVGVELEAEWCPSTDGQVRADALRLPFPDSVFDALATSPAYGNRMADSHEAKDRCKACGGGGKEVLLSPPPDSIGTRPCRACGGQGLSRRNTYTHTLGRKPSPGSSTTMQWGKEYRAFHEAVWRECDRVLKPGALVFLNVKNHVRDGREQHVAEWHLNAWMMLGASVHHVERVRTPGNRFGQNGEARVDGELLAVLQTRRA